jgi:DNA polymerase-3 subunit gamma/tau
MIALARKYRPKTFADLIVQDHVAAALRGAVAQNRVAHGYLFAGPRGVGKTTAARILAMALNASSERRRGALGVQVPHLDGVGTDVVELDAAEPRRGRRHDLGASARQPGGRSRSKTSTRRTLTREAECLSILGEPPRRCSCSRPPSRKRSRRRPRRTVAAAALDVASARRSCSLQHAATEGVVAQDDALHLIAKSADGGMRDGLSIRSGPSSARGRSRPSGSAGVGAHRRLYGECCASSPSGRTRGLHAGHRRAKPAPTRVAWAAWRDAAVLLVGLGGELGRGGAALVRRYVPRLPPADVVRLLTAGE